MSLTTNVYNFSLTRGDSCIHQITVKSTDESAKDVTGATVTYTVRANSKSGTQVIQKTVNNGIVLTTPTSGILTVTLNPADTALDVGRKYFYDCQVTLSGVVQTVQAGQITVVGEVTS